MSTGTNPTLHDEVAVRQLVAHLIQAWNNHDGIAFGQPFCEDAEYRVIWGNKIRGRAEIANGHQWLFSTHYAQTRLEGTIESLRFLHPDVVYIEAVFHLHNVQMPDGSPYPFEKAIAGMTAVKNNGEWAIATFNNAGILHATVPN